jgi:hypothetical protein
MLNAKIAAMLRRHRHRREVKNARKALLSADQIHNILKREREFAERTGAPLTVATFAVREQSEAAATVAWLAIILKGRLRCLDAFGWLDDQRLCAVFPATPIQGAWKVVDDVCRIFPLTISPPVCDVYSYREFFVWFSQEDAESLQVRGGESRGSPIHCSLPVARRRNTGRDGRQEVQTDVDWTHQPAKVPQTDGEEARPSEAEQTIDEEGEQRAQSGG